MPDKYSLEARYVPALVCSVPFFFLWFYYLQGLDGSFWQSASALAVGSIGLSTALFLVAVHVCRAVGKVVEEWLFKKGLSFPTTEFLLDGDNNLSADCKSKIRAKMHAKFGIDLTGTTTDSDSDRRTIHEAVGQIRSMFYRKNDMLLQRNIQFGMAKNLFGGCVLAVLASALGATVSAASNAPAALHVSLALLAGYLVIGLTAFFMIRFTARHYAHSLYDEFLAS